MPMVGHPCDGHLMFLQEMEKVLQNLDFLTMSEPLEAEGTATSP